jgi:hypothetical protein
MGSSRKTMKGNEKETVKAKAGLSERRKSDTSASQSDALSRTSDLLMEKEDLLKKAEAMHNFNLDLNKSQQP